MRKIPFIFALCLPLMAIFSCQDYEGSQLNEMAPSTITFTRATGIIQGCSFSGSITEIVDCELTLTGFDGTKTTVKIDENTYNSDIFQTTAANSQFLTRIALKRNGKPIDKHSYDYSFKPGKLTGECFVHKETGVDSTYTLSCANTERSGVIYGDTIDNVLQPMTETQVKEWMKTIYNGGVRADFSVLLNEMGWPMIFVRNDYEVVYDFE